MEQPAGFVAQWEIGKVCHIFKALYGLANLFRQLRHLACRKVSLTTLSSIRTPILVLFYW